VAHTNIHARLALSAAGLSARSRAASFADPCDTSKANSPPAALKGGGSVKHLRFCADMEGSHDVPPPEMLHAVQSLHLPDRLPLVFLVVFGVTVAMAKKKK
jgi:hypothetical protein